MDIESCREIYTEACEIWQAGGWAMIALAVNALILFAVGSALFLRQLGRGTVGNAQRAWERWRKRPVRRTMSASIINQAMRIRSVDGVRSFFDHYRYEEMAPFERDLEVMKVAVGTAPLLGLLGTVTGMLATFFGLAEGGGGDKTMNMIAGGISEALITTETGLVIALVGMIFQFVLARQHEHFETFIAHLENLCVQSVGANNIRPMCRGE